MKLKSSMAALAVAMAFSAPVGATDLLDEKYDPAPDGVSVNWSGVYVGGAIGYGNANHDLTAYDYFKDYCDKGLYGSAKANEVPTLVTDGDDPDAFEDPNRFFLFGGDDLVGCTPPVATNRKQNPQYAPIGIESGNSREIANLDGLNTTGIVGDFRLGYDQQMGRFVFGLFGTYGLSTMNGEGSDLGNIKDFAMERGDDWSAGARAGILVNDSTLLYALAAYTQTDYEFSGTHIGEAFSQKTTFDGITVGGGIEFAVSNSVFLGLEGTHTFYNEETIADVYDADTNIGTSVNDDLGETKIMGTLKIKLNSF